MTIIQPDAKHTFNDCDDRGNRAAIAHGFRHRLADFKIQRLMVIPLRRELPQTRWQRKRLARQAAGNHRAFQRDDRSWAGNRRENLLMNFDGWHAPSNVTTDGIARISNEQTLANSRVATRPRVRSERCAAVTPRVA